MHVEIWWKNKAREKNVWAIKARASTTTTTIKATKADSFNWCTLRSHAIRQPKELPRRVHYYLLLSGGFSFGIFVETMTMPSVCVVSFHRLNWSQSAIRENCYNLCIMYIYEYKITISCGKCNVSHNLLVNWSKKQQIKQMSETKKLNKIKTKTI